MRLIVLGAVLLAPLAGAQEPAASGGPLTVAEASRWQRTSRLDDVLRFIERLEGLPRGDRLEVLTFGATVEGRPLTAVTARLEPGGPPRASVLVNANIHGGEVEGKTAVQMILRDIAMGEHDDILQVFDVTFVPVFNADGNDAISRRNRVSQNGPNGGVGRRPNAQGLDLNRDFVKVESPEVRALLGLANRLRPVAFFDLHTTNGSNHGYDLTFAPSLSPNAGPPDVIAFQRDVFFPAVTERMAERGHFVFDYGNFGYARRGAGSRGDRGDPVRWSTYDPRPRFGTNMFGIRGTTAILSEAFSYQPFRRRVESTYLFTLACLRELTDERVRSKARVHREWAEALDAMDVPTGAVLATAPRLEDGTREPVRVGTVRDIEVDLGPDAPAGRRGDTTGRRRLASPSSEAREVEMLVQRRFVGTAVASAGQALAVIDPSPELIGKLRVHLGPARPLRLLRAPLEVSAARFELASVEWAERPFQGHNVVSVRGAWGEDEALTLPAGTLLVRSTPLTAQLLSPESDDSLTTWNVFDEQLLPGGGGADLGPAHHPVIRLGQLPDVLRKR